MILQILSKIFSESLLSLYPIFVKYINLSLGLQIWSRLFTYMFISIFFINWKFIFDTILSKSGILLSLITILHVYASYRGFLILESGIAYVLFYLYPLIILLLAGEKIGFIIIFALIGVYLLSQQKIENFKNDVFKKTTAIENFKYEGVLMMIIAAFTEALIFFIVKNIKTKNNWNHLFISYALGAILLTVYFWKDIVKIKINSNLSISMIINAIIGLFGNLLRFYAISNLSAKIYAPLSYFGILMAFIYGIFINKDVITIQKIIGSLFILIPNFYQLVLVNN
jgi:drug/metabolite transporter (DMT)-like permease